MKRLLIVLFLMTLPGANAFALNAGDAAPAFSLRDINDRNFYLRDYVGPMKKHDAKGIILSFFASWCKPCRSELPVLNGLVEEFEKSGIKVVIVGFNEGFDKITQMLEEIKVDKPIVLSDRYGKVGERFGVRSLPMTFFIGADGNVKDVIRGELPEIGKELTQRAAILVPETPIPK